MSITYEEALSTLQAMFGPPWTQESLDAVLRHHKGHMENTVESILGHGSGDPDDLIQKLQSPNDIDEQIAQQLAREGAPSSSAPATSQRSNTSHTASSQSTKGRGTHTTLPPDFLRIPGYQGDAGVRSPEMDQDEQLARMLQDELFSQELANNPEFAHLARPRTVGGRPSNAPGRGRGRVGELPSRTGSVGGHGSQPAGIQGAEIMAKVSEMGENAKRRFRMFTAQFNQRVAGAGSQDPAPAGSGGAGGTTGAAAERRGLLDGDGGDDDDGMEMAFGGKKDL